MNDIKITGEVVHVDEVKEYGANAFRKHVVVVKTGDDKWANPIPVEFTKEAIEKSTQLKTGAERGHRRPTQWTGMEGTGRGDQMVRVRQRLRDFLFRGGRSF